MVKEIIFVGLGSCAGGIGRYLLTLLMKGASAHFPWGTMIVNILGCLLIGMLMALCDKMPNGHLHLMLTVGFCGGFTTFSTFSKECLNLLQIGNYTAFALYALGSLVIGIAAVALGFAIVK
ncbi:MAG: fluoride efflux transporter CrcB [Bacteroidales bacterium]|nr:fluoride efflux transporter CrcB [Bacteroidales bacterium]